MPPPPLSPLFFYLHAHTLVHEGRHRDKIPTQPSKRENTGRCLQIQIGTLHIYTHAHTHTLSLYIYIPLYLSIYLFFSHTYSSSGQHEPLGVWGWPRGSVLEPVAVMMHSESRTTLQEHEEPLDEKMEGSRDEKKK